MKNIIGDTMPKKKRLAKRNDITGGKEEPTWMFMLTTLVLIGTFYTWLIITFA